MRNTQLQARFDRVGLERRFRKPHRQTEGLTLFEGLDLLCDVDPAPSNLNVTCRAFRLMQLQFTPGSTKT